MIHLLLTKQNIEPVGNTLATHPAPGKPLKRQFRFSRRSSAWQSNGLLNRWSRVQIPAPAHLPLRHLFECDYVRGQVDNQTRTLTFEKATGVRASAAGYRRGYVAGSASSPSIAVPCGRKSS